MTGVASNGMAFMTDFVTNGLTGSKVPSGTQTLRRTHIWWL